MATQAKYHGTLAELRDVERRWFRFWTATRVTIIDRLLERYCKALFLLPAHIRPVHLALRSGNWHNDMDSAADKMDSTCASLKRFAPTGWQVLTAGNVACLAAVWH